MIVNNDGKYYFKDCSDLDFERAYLIKLGRVQFNKEPDVVNEIVPNDIISFFNHTLYVIKNISNNEVEMSLVKEIAGDTSEDYKQPDKQIKKPIPEGGLIVSRLRPADKVTIKHM